MRDLWVHPGVVERTREDRDCDGPSLGTARVRSAVVVPLETSQSANDKPHDEQQRQSCSHGRLLLIRVPLELSHVATLSEGLVSVIT